MGGYWRVNFFFKLRHVNELNREMNSSETWITEPFEQHHYELELRSLSSAELFLNSELWITEHIVELWAQKHIIITSHELRTDIWRLLTSDWMWTSDENWMDSGVWLMVMMTMTTTHMWTDMWTSSVQRCEEELLLKSSLSRAVMNYLNWGLTSDWWRIRVELRTETPTCDWTLTSADIWL